MTADTVHSMLKDLRDAMRTLVSDVGILKNEMGSMKTDVGVLKTEMDVLNTEMDAAKATLGTVQLGMATLNQRLFKLESAPRWDITPDTSNCWGEIDVEYEVCDCECDAC
jgi:hypothetical protein